jgi:V8-like Glu-specific endopeptidase
MKKRFVTLSMTALAGMLSVGASAPSFAQNGVSHAGAPNARANAQAALPPYRSPMPLIDESQYPVGGFAESAGAAPQGKAGAAPSSIDGDAVAPEAFGTGTQRWPYSTARVAVQVLGNSTSAARTPVTSYPFRATGKLVMVFSNGTFVCSASLIRPAVLVTAAHCIQRYGQGAGGRPTSVRWYPGLSSAFGPAAVPYGEYVAAQWFFPTVYSNGTDTCQSGAIGVVCNNDVAVVVLNQRAGVNPGSVVGWYGYGWNGFSHIGPATGSAFPSTVAEITQLGYPQAFDLGQQMQRTDSMGKYLTSTGANAKLLEQTQIGSAQTGGSSGGPWLVNFGTRPSTSASASLGNASNSNIVVGTTSWGFITVGLNVQGASHFGQNAEFPLASYGAQPGAGNIGALVNAACTFRPSAC